MALPAEEVDWDLAAGPHCELLAVMLWCPCTCCHIRNAMAMRLMILEKDILGSCS